MMSNHIVTTESPVAVTTEAAAEPTLVLRGHVGDALDGYSQNRTIVDGAHHTIQWAPGTVDNEYMGRKKSKCCCIYEKPRNWDDPSSSSDSDSESDSPNPKKCTEHCRGHTKHCYTKKAAAKLATDSVSATEQNPGGPSQSPSDPKTERS